ncbi:MAG TPA: hypothetical protein VIR01_05925, partial [Pyrinomonadaceae bacterium]
MKRRQFLTSTTASCALAIVAPVAEIGANSSRTLETPRAFELDEMTIQQLQQGMQSGKFSSRSLVEKYSERINDIDKHGPAVNSIIELNPEA